jgi:GNAT superfamily N-acetyltransferase
VTQPQRLRKLAATDELSTFTCGTEEIDEWLRKRALKGQIAGNANVFVFEHSGRVLGFYALATGSVERSSAPSRVGRNAPDPIPILLLARLGVDRSAQGRGIGKRFLQDALVRSIDIADEVGFRALLVHCQDIAARDYYLSVVPGFLRSPVDELHLLLPLTGLFDIYKSIISPE